MFHRLGSAILPVLLALFFITSNVMGQSGYKSEEELIRAAEKFFNEKNYEKAFPLFSQIVSNRPDNSHYNYCLGVCIMEVAPDKAEAVRFLELATKSPQNPNDSWLYLGKAYHSSYKYDEAISAFQSYKLNAGRSAWNNANGDALIQMCKNGIDVKNDLSLQRHRILEKSETVTMDFFLLYKNIPEAGRFLKLPKEYEDKSTKGSHESAYVFLPSSGNTLVYSNASKTNGKGYDIFRVLKDSKGLWMFPEMLSDIINSSGDEAFPVIVNDGKTLYFSSKGARSTGGYDIFRSDLDLSTSSWSEPVPMGPPINSPDDDFYYVPSVDNKFAYFSSNRESAAGKCKVYKVSIINETRNFIAISGLFNCKSGLELSEAKVTIMNPDDRSIIAQFRTPSQDGNYNLKLPVPSTFIYQVELAGFNSQEQLVDLTGYASTKLIQEIYLVRTDEAKENMTITNRIPVEDKVIAGNKSSVNPSITQNVGDRDMALATTNNRNTAVAKSENKPNGEEQNTVSVDGQNNSSKSNETSPSNSSIQTKVTATDNSASSTSKVSPSESGTTNERNTSSANTKSASTTNSEPVELVTIENLTPTSGSENKPVNENEKAGNGNAVSANESGANSSVNSNKVNIAPVSESIASGTTTNATAGKNASDSEKSNVAKVAESKSEGSKINSEEGVLQTQKSSNTNLTSEELVTASAELSAPIENKSSDKSNSADSKINSDEPIKSSTETPASSKNNLEVNTETNPGKNSVGSLSTNSSTKSSAENSNSAIGTTPSSISETTPGGINNLSQSSTKNTNENGASESLNMVSGNENKTSNPMVSGNGSTSSTSNETTASTESKKSTEPGKSNTVSSTSKEQSNNSSSSELVSGNENTVAATSENRNSSASNPNSSATSSSGKELEAASKSNSSPITESERNSETNSSEKSNSHTSDAKVSQPAGQTTAVTTSLPVSTSNATAAATEKEVASTTPQQKSTSPTPIASSQSNAAISTNTIQSLSELPTSDTSVNAQTHAVGNSDTPASAPEDNGVNQTASAEINNSPNSSPEVEKGSSNEVASSGKSEKRSGIFGSRSKKKDKEVAPVTDAIPEFASTQPIAEEMPEPPKNLIFRVQLGAYKDRNADDLKKKYSDIGLTDLIYVKNDDGLLLVMTGSEKSYDSALTLKATMIEKGVADAFIVAYSDGTRLPLESVVKIDE